MPYFGEDVATDDSSDGEGSVEHGQHSFFGDGDVIVFYHLF